jgi:hypothetical protein
MADQQLPLDEGMASFWGLEHNRVGRDSLIAFVNSAKPKFVLGSHSFLTGIPTMWNAPHTVYLNTTIPANRKVRSPDGDTIRLVSQHIQTGARYEIRKYKWLDVPGEFVFYNEMMCQAYLQLFHEFAFERKDTAFQKILSAAKGITAPRERLRYPASIANQLALSMERHAATARGQAEEAAGTLTSSMFAYALYDILTHFGMSEADMKRELSINMATYLPFPKPQAYDAYWSRRNAVRQLACPFLGGSNCVSGTGAIDIVRAVTAARDYFRDSSRILR